MDILYSEGINIHPFTRSYTFLLSLSVSNSFSYIYQKHLNNRSSITNSPFIFLSQID